MGMRHYVHVSFGYNMSRDLVVHTLQPKIVVEVSILDTSTRTRGQIL